MKTGISVLLLALLPAVFVLSELVDWIPEEGVGSDLGVAYLGAARAVLQGRSPYPDLTDTGIAEGTAFVYPPILAFAATPLTAIPPEVVVDIGMVSVIGFVIAVLWLAGVRDWRCFGVAFLWPSTSNEMVTLNASVIVACMLAVAWRLRRSEVASGVVTGAAVAVKLFIWPIVIWPLSLRRQRGFAALAGVTLVLVLGGWAVIGFAGLTQYPDLVRRLTDSQARDSYSVFAAIESLGAAKVIAQMFAYALTAALLLAGWHAGRAGNERRSFVLALLACLTATPILWQHYLLLLMLALAVARPRFSWPWLLPLAAWTAPHSGNGSVFETLLVPGTAAVVGLVAVQSASPLPDDQRRLGTAVRPSG